MKGWIVLFTEENYIADLKTIEAKLNTSRTRTCSIKEIAKVAIDRYLQSENYQLLYVDKYTLSKDIELKFISYYYYKVIADATPFGARNELQRTNLDNILLQISGEFDENYNAFEMANLNEVYSFLMRDQYFMNEFDSIKTFNYSLVLHKVDNRRNGRKKVVNQHIDLLNTIYNDNEYLRFHFLKQIRYHTVESQINHNFMSNIVDCLSGLKDTDRVKYASALAHLSDLRLLKSKSKFLNKCLKDLEESKLDVEGIVELVEEFNNNILVNIQTYTYMLLKYMLSDNRASVFAKSILDLGVEPITNLCSIDKNKEAYVEIWDIFYKKRRIYIESDQHINLDLNLNINSLQDMIIHILNKDFEKKNLFNYKLNIDDWVNDLSERFLYTHDLVNCFNLQQTIEWAVENGDKFSNYTPKYNRRENDKRFISEYGDFESFDYYFNKNEFYRFCKKYYSGTAVRFGGNGTIYYNKNLAKFYFIVFYTSGEEVFSKIKNGDFESITYSDFKQFINIITKLINSLVYIEGRRNTMMRELERHFSFHLINKIIISTHHIMIKHRRISRRRLNMIVKRFIEVSNINEVNTRYKYIYSHDEIDRLKSYQDDYSEYEIKEIYRRIDDMVFSCLKQWLSKYREEKIKEIFKNSNAIIENNYINRFNESCNIDQNSTEKLFRIIMSQIKSQEQLY